MTARLYVTGLSNPSRAVAGMASRKRLPYRLGAERRPQLSDGSGGMVASSR